MSVHFINVSPLKKPNFLLLWHAAALSVGLILSTVASKWAALYSTLHHIYMFHLKTSQHVAYGVKSCPWLIFTPHTVHVEELSRGQELCYFVRISCICRNKPSGFLVSFALRCFGRHCHRHLPSEAGRSPLVQHIYHILKWL